MPFVKLIAPLLGLSLMTGCTSAAHPPGIYVLNTEGETAALVGQPAGIPSWSPKQDTLAWASEDGLALVNIEPANITRLVNTDIAGRPAWAPDGAAIAYFDDDAGALTVVDATSGSIEMQVSVATDPRWSSSIDMLSMGGPDWSPDGKRLAFVCWDGAGDELCVVNNGGDQLRQITRLGPTNRVNADPARIMTATSNIGPPSWAPDGRAIAVAAYPERSGAPTGVFLVDLDAGTARQLGKLLPNSEISWSPDGKWLYFSATEKGRSDVVRVSTKDGSTTKLTTSLPGGARNPAVTIDGTRIAAISQGRLVILDQGKTTTETKALGLKESWPAWNAQGSAVAFSATEDLIANYN